MESIRKCVDCSLEVYNMDDIIVFSKDRRQTIGYRNLCKECENKRNQKWKKANPKESYLRDKRRTVKYKYGITLEEYIECMSISDVCEHCGTSEELCYDHDHNKPKDVRAFRGVLCRKCNSALGKLGDTLEDIERLLNYLKRSDNNNE